MIKEFIKGFKSEWTWFSKEREPFNWEYLGGYIALMCKFFAYIFFVFGAVAAILFLIQFLGSL